MVYNRGDIIEAPYHAMGEERTSLFVVLYNEALDLNTHHTKNILCMKLTTSLHFNDKYSFTLDPKVYDLPKPTLLRVNKLNTVNTEDVFRYYGTLKKQDWNQALSIWEQFKKEIHRQNKIKY